ncbi:unnamed protein product [Angiostrongylus costaricensis]|uniref:CBS domain-containing protein n=1 Tax=Angiostrongylus costaricensis TaxID=334426 RepID=A0A0R3PFQ4_ANGCS|nr:unnamed protein product [Angiostrongylus costaricensis]
MLQDFVVVQPVSLSSSVLAKDPLIFKRYNTVEKLVVMDTQKKYRGYFEMELTLIFIRLVRQSFVETLSPSNVL